MFREDNRITRRSRKVANEDINRDVCRTAIEYSTVKHVEERVSKLSDDISGKSSYVRPLNVVIGQHMPGRYFWLKRDEL
ncbi:hypothetical protein BGX23_002291 [Mortierella sp. AD031]|nr:hypothetical protein BGX23_002291 [Mortierella sp. AD031]